jgi:hypothetical protein
MAAKPTNDALTARAEAAVLLGLDPKRPLCPADNLRVQLVCSLRAVIDHAGETALEGSAVDIARLLSATEALTKLLPGRELPQPAYREGGADDPRQLLLDMYMTARRNGGVSDQGALVDEIAALKAENALLRAGPTPPAPSPPVTPAPNVVPLSRPAPKNAPAASATPPATPAGYDYSANEDWKGYVNSDGSIRTSPRGRWDI